MISSPSVPATAVSVAVIVSVGIISSKIVPIPSGLIILTFPVTFEMLIFIVSPLSDI